MKKLYNVTNGTWHLETSEEELSLILTAIEDRKEKMAEILGTTKDEKIKKWLKKKIKMMYEMLEAMEED